MDDVCNSLRNVYLVC